MKIHKCSKNFNHIILECSYRRVNCFLVLRIICVFELNLLDLTAEVKRMKRLCSYLYLLSVLWSFCCLNIAFLGTLQTPFASSVKQDLLLNIFLSEPLLKIINKHKSALTICCNPFSVDGMPLQVNEIFSSVLLWFSVIFCRLQALKGPC